MHYQHDYGILKSEVLNMDVRESVRFNQHRGIAVKNGGKQRGRKFLHTRAFLFLLCESSAIEIYFSPSVH
jgi:hypothetical protein